jgi:transcriptional regulator with GAF, ATPase, and Fis domain
MLAMRVFREHIAGAQPSPTPPAAPAAGAWPAGPLPHFKEVHRALLVEAMRRAQDNQSVASGLLGMKRTTFNAHWLKHGPKPG